MCYKRIIIHVGLLGMELFFEKSFFGSQVGRCVERLAVRFKLAAEAARCSGCDSSGAGSGGCGPLRPIADGGAPMAVVKEPVMSEACPRLLEVRGGGSQSVLPLRRRGRTSGVERTAAERRR